MTFHFKLLREYDESYQTERSVVFSDTVSSGLVPLWEDIGVYDILYNSDGQQARQISRTLAYGLDRLNTDTTSANLISGKQSDSLNEASRFLEAVLKACTLHPSARIETS